MHRHIPKVQLADIRQYHERKEVKTMKYETPELTALVPAINAVQSSAGAKVSGAQDSQHPRVNDILLAYEDWEE